LTRATRIYEEEGTVANQLIVPRILFDVGALCGWASAIYIGVEWQYWRNKFGRKDFTESVPQFQIKLQF
jgi:hypothetical protein